MKLDRHMNGRIWVFVTGLLLNSMLGVAPLMAGQENSVAPGLQSHSKVALVVTTPTVELPVTCILILANPLIPPFSEQAEAVATYWSAAIDLLLSNPSPSRELESVSAAARSAHAAAYQRAHRRLVFNAVEQYRNRIFEELRGYNVDLASTLRDDLRVCANYIEEAKPWEDWAHSVPEKKSQN